ncbi:hypothetical protein V5O48_009896 [Marasmius crinis-equi]|uniref:NADH:flavin oxidoreductase/NADH oxidase N-terminal domain-containing protein n=1 Tax=Marasmius crinis-equi TaxID=585013 RepID=A0ABR3F9V0_9AGAR
MEYTSSKASKYLHSYVDSGVKDPVPTYSHLVEEVKKAHPTLAYIHVADAPVDGGVANIHDTDSRTNGFIREIWATGPEGNEAEVGRRLISAGNFDLATGTDLADTKGDLVAYGRKFLANPDLPYRLKYNIPLTAHDKSTFYLAGSVEARGYTDYPLAAKDSVQITPHL